MERGRAFTESNVEDLVLAEVAGRGSKADPARETMFVDVQKTRAQPILKLRVLVQYYLVIEAFGRGYGYALQLCDILISPLVVFEGGVLFQQLRGAVPRPDSRKTRVEIASASLAAELVTAYPQLHGIHATR